MLKFVIGIAVGFFLAQKGTKSQDDDLGEVSFADKFNYWGATNKCDNCDCSKCCACCDCGCKEKVVNCAPNCRCN